MSDCNSYFMMGELYFASRVYFILPQGIATGGIHTLSLSCVCVCVSCNCSCIVILAGKQEAVHRAWGRRESPFSEIHFRVSLRA